MRHVAAAVICVLITACGGSRPSPEDFLPGPDLAQAEVQAMLERCAVPDLERLFTMLNTFDALLDPDAPDPPLTFTGLRILDGCIDWMLDTDTDGIFDVSGSFCFRDENGIPIFPFNPINLGNGVDEVADLLAGLPDGTHVIVSFSQDGVGVGAFDVTFDQGTAQRGSGSVRYDHDDCTMTYGFTDVRADDLLAPRPNALVAITIDSNEGPAVGTLSMNGTETGVLSLTKDGRVFVFTVDLDTFELQGFGEPI